MLLDRTKSLLGEDGIKKLQNASVTIVGVGGVGGEVAVLLARAGVGRLRLIDFDVVDETNINRQTVAYTNTVGKKKTDVLAEIIKKINPNCLVEAISKRLTKENVGELLGDADFKTALRSGTGALVGFLLGTVLKLALCMYFIVLLVRSLI